MIMKKTVILATAFAFAFSMAVAVGTSFADNGPADMTLKTAAAKKPATFPHKKHQDAFECNECHHTAGDGKAGPYVAGQEKKCESCHNSDMASPKLNSYKAVGHALCKGCHKKMAAEGKNAPTKCAGCHPKK